MKLRAKFGGQSALVDLGDVEASGVTLQQLKVSTAEQFGLINSDINLSLNKRDLLSGDDIVISEFGIVPGDLIHVTSSQEPPVVPVKQSRRQPMATHHPVLANPMGLNFKNQDNRQRQSINRNSNNNDDDSSAAKPVTGQAASTSSSLTSDESQQPNENYHPIQRPLDEPLVIRESTAQRVPALLQELFTGSEIQCPNDALFILLHALMLESGFYLPENDDMTVMPEGWKKAGLYVTTYQYFLSSTVVSDCCLMAVTTGSSMAIHGLSKTVGNFKTDHLQLKADNYVRDISQANAAAAYRSLDRISTMFKDTIGLELQNQLATSAGFRETQGLLSLPCEIKLRLMCFLDAQSVCNLGQTCRQWKAVYKDNKVWRKMFLEGFGRLEDNSLSRNWFELFRDQYEVFVREQERRRQLYSTEVDPFRGWPHIMPGRPFDPFPQPRLLGGDHDLFPDLTGGIGVPGLRSGRGLDPFRNQNPPGGARRSNHTGSPFFNNRGTFL